MTGLGNIRRDGDSQKDEIVFAQGAERNTRRRRAVIRFVLPVAGLLAIVGIEAASIAANLPQAQSDLMVVVAWPWGLAAGEIARAAGGRVIGPVTGPNAALVTDASVPALKAAGAMLVLDETYAGWICGTKTGEE